MFNSRARGREEIDVKEAAAEATTSRHQVRVKINEGSAVATKRSMEQRSLGTRRRQRGWLIVLVERLVCLNVTDTFTWVVELNSCLYIHAAFCVHVIECLLIDFFTFCA